MFEGESQERFGRRHNLVVAGERRARPAGYATGKRTDSGTFATGEREDAVRAMELKRKDARFDFIEPTP